MANAELFAVFDLDGCLIDTFERLESANELEQLRYRRGLGSSVTRFSSGARDIPELPALRALVMDLESFAADSGWHNLAREIRLRRKWAASKRPDPLPPSERKGEG